MFGFTLHLTDSVRGVGNALRAFLLDVVFDVITGVFVVVVGDIIVVVVVVFEGDSSRVMGEFQR